MKDKQSVSVFLSNHILFFLPVQYMKETGIGTAEIEKMMFIPYAASASEKEAVLRQALSQSGNRIPSHLLECDEKTQLRKWEPFLRQANAKTIGAFDSKALSFSVYFDSNCFVFTPGKYNRGGFSGIRESKFTIPSDSSDEELDKAIDRILGACIGKDGKLLADFLKEPPRLSKSGPKEAPSLGISGFGFKNMWFAVKSTDSLNVAHALGISAPREVSWNEGIEAAYGKNSVFITPPIDGWVLAVGWGLMSTDATIETELIERLSSTFDEAQYFATHRGSEAHCWIKAVAGKIVRAYSYADGESTLVEGEPTEVERNSNLFNSFSPEAAKDGYWEQATHPDEDFVMRVATTWSINPSELSSRDDIMEKGLLGKIDQR